MGTGNHHINSGIYKITVKKRNDFHAHDFADGLSKSIHNKMMERSEKVIKDKVEVLIRGFVDSLLGSDNYYEKKSIVGKSVADALTGCHASDDEVKIEIDRNSILINYIDDLRSQYCSLLRALSELSVSGEASSLDDFYSIKRGLSTAFEERI